jgi:hypothetical protein
METVTPEPGKSSPPLEDSKNETILVQHDGAALKDSTEAELTKISLMRAFVESRDPSSKVCNYKTIENKKLATFCNYNNLCHVLSLPS